MDKRFAAAIFGTIMCSSAESTLFVPSDASVNFIDRFGAAPPTILSDDQDRVVSASRFARRASGGQAAFPADASGYRAISVFGGLPDGVTAAEVDRFPLTAWSSQRNTWWTPEVFECSGMATGCVPDRSRLRVVSAFGGGAGRPPLPAPISPSLFLFASALFGLVVVGRRRTAFPQ